MIFVPSREGISHNPEEYTSPEHCTLGAQVLLDAVLEYDDRVRYGEIGAWKLAAELE
jgi:acetylornithine deacetylase/succinyl-diaminopimelate desuccinylase-like protein